MSEPRSCPVPECEGLVDDGYCGRCGEPAPTPDSAPTSGSAPAQSTGGGSSESSRSGPSGWTSGDGGSHDPLPALPPLPSAPAEPESGSDDPMMPMDKRYCPYCRSPAGRSPDGANFCLTCGEPVSFRPPLRRGERVGGHLVVGRALAHGGQGWVYRAWHEKFEIEVVLKGLLDPDDDHGRRAAVDEAKALAKARHPNIVRVYETVTQPLRRPRKDGSVDVVDLHYIVMDHVPGRSLKQLLLAHGPMEIPLVLRYLVSILRALRHLHELGLLYCDLAPDQLIHTDTDPPELVLVDMGAVRRRDAVGGVLYGRSAYQDPVIESGDEGPSVITDLYTVGRTALRLGVAQRGFTDVPHRPPPTSREHPELAPHEGYLRLVRRFLDTDRTRRFRSASEAIVQVEGVLRQETARALGRPCPGPSSLFGPEVAVVDADADAFPVRQADAAAVAFALPGLQIDPADPHAGLIAALAVMQPADRRRELRGLAHPSTESRLRAAAAGVRLGGADRVDGVAELDALCDALPHDPRPRYRRGVATLAMGDPEAAAPWFSAVLDQWPGELAPVLAMGVCAEWAGNDPTAIGHYQIVWQTDHAYVGAAFGLARCLFAVGDRDGAAAVLDSVPLNSRYGTTARLCGILARARSTGSHVGPANGFFHAAEQLGSSSGELADLDERRRTGAVAEVFEHVLQWLLAGRRRPPGCVEPVPMTLLGAPLTERGVRDALERACRRLADLDPSARTAHMDKANKWRNWSWL